MVGDGSLPRVRAQAAVTEGEKEIEMPSATSTRRWQPGSGVRTAERTVRQWQAGKLQPSVYRLVLWKRNQISLSVKVARDV